MSDNLIMAIIDRNFSDSHIFVVRSKFQVNERVHMRTMLAFYMTFLHVSHIPKLPGIVAQGMSVPHGNQTHSHLTMVSNFFDIFF